MIKMVSSDYYMNILQLLSEQFNGMAIDGKMKILDNKISDIL